MNRQEIVEKMGEAIWNAAGMDWRPQDFSKASKAERERCLRAADAALSVAIDELLGEPGLDEIQMHDKINGNPSRLRWSDINWYLAYRRRTLERVKTSEDRVTVAQVKIGVTPNFWNVFLDGRSQCVQFLEQSDAEIYRLGLIQKLKEQLPKNQ